MKKLLLIIGIAISSVMSIQAQEGLSIGGNVSFSFGDGNNASLGIGLDAQYLFKVSDKLDLGFATGYMNIFSKDYLNQFGESVRDQDTKFIPISLAIRYNLSDKWRLGSDIGYAALIDSGSSGGGLYIKPMIGYNIRPKSEINLSATGLGGFPGRNGFIGTGIKFGL